MVMSLKKPPRQQNSDLRFNGAKVIAFRHAVANCNIELIPKVVREIIDSQAWRKFVASMEPFENASFIEFIRDPPHKGCGWQPTIVQGLIEKCGDKTLLRKWRKAITPPVGSNQFTEGNNNIITRQGTSLAYTLDRLHRTRPDLLAKVEAGEMSANAAAIEAGFRKRPKHRCPKCGHEFTD
jgi:hypothetical protein